MVSNELDPGRGGGGSDFDDGSDSSDDDGDDDEPTRRRRSSSSTADSTGSSSSDQLTRGGGSSSDGPIASDSSDGEEDSSESATYGSGGSDAELDRGEDSSGGSSFEHDEARDGLGDSRADQLTSGTDRSGPSSGPRPERLDTGSQDVEEATRGAGTSGSNFRRERIDTGSQRVEEVTRGRDSAQTIRLSDADQEAFEEAFQSRGQSDQQRGGEPGIAATAIGRVTQDIANTPVGRSVGAGFTGAFGDDLSDAGALGGVDTRLESAEDAFDRRVVEPIESADVDDRFERFGRDVTAQTADFANPAGIARDLMTGTEFAGRGVQQITAGPEGVQRAGETVSRVGSESPSSVRAAGEFVAENPRDSAVTGTALLATGGLGIAASRGVRGGASAARRVADLDAEDVGSARVGTALSTARQNTPTVRTRRDPDAGLIEVDQRLTDGISGSSSTGPRVSGGVNRAAGDSLSDIFGTAGRPSQPPRDTRTRRAAERLTEPSGDSLSDILGTARGGRETPSAPNIQLSTGVRSRVAEANRPAGESLSDIFGTAGRAGSRRPIRRSDVFSGAGSRARSAFDSATQPAGDSLSDIFGTAGRRGSMRPLPRSDIDDRFRQRLSDVGDRASGIADSATQPAGDSLSEIFGTAGRSPAVGPMPRSDVFSGAGSRARSAFDSATQPAGDSLSDIFGTAGRTGRSRIAPATPGSDRVRSAVESATQPAGDSLGDIFGTAPRARQGSVLDTTFRISPRGSRRADLDETPDEIGGGAFGDDVFDRPSGGADTDFASAGSDSGDGTLALTSRIDTDTVDRQPTTPPQRSRTSTDVAGAGATVGVSGSEFEPAEPEISFSGVDDVTTGVGTATTTATGVDVGSDTGTDTTSTPEVTTSLSSPTTTTGTTATDLTSTTTTTTRSGTRTAPRTPGLPELGLGGGSARRRGEADQDAFEFGFEPDTDILTGEEI